ncbi:MAG: thioredoxin family protein [Armatimonadota bacterium]|nr:thioredoxin family protein [bacterium]
MLKRFVSLVFFSGLLMYAITGAILADKPLDEDQLKAKKLEDITHARELYIQGENAYKNGRLEDAITSWVQAIELKPDSDYTKKCLAKARAALVVKYTKESQRLQKNADLISESIMLGSGLKLVPDDPALLQRLGEVNAKLTDSDKKAITAHDEAMAAYAKTDCPKAYESIKAALIYGRGSEYLEKSYTLIEKAYYGGSAESNSINWQQDCDRAFDYAQSAKMPVMINFYANWCGQCKRMDRNTYPNPGVVTLSRQFVCVKVDSDKNRDLVRKFNVIGYPTIIFLDSISREANRVSGYREIEWFLRDMKKALKGN